MIYGAMNSPLRPILDEVKAIAELKFDYLELAMDPPHGDARTIKKQKSELLEGLKRYDLGLVCHLPTFLSTADLTDRLRRASVEEVIASLEVAAEIQPLKVVLHPSYMMGLGAFVPDLTRAHALESLEIIVEKAHALGLCLCLENMFPKTQWLTDPEEFVEVLAKFPTLNLLLDIGHAHIEDTGGKKCMRFIEMFPGRIGHLHVSDNFGKEDQHLPIGAGIIDFSNVVKALKKTGYSDTITLEVFSRDRDYLKMSKKKMEEMFEKIEDRIQKTE
jgi:sugar phosphate isomerase/epimerase